jgi:membrane-associated phospholipid phosphatase
MTEIQADKSKSSFRISVIVSSLIPVLRSKYLYIAILSVVVGIAMNFASQTYLHNYMSEGKTLPMLSDLILDILPVIDVSIIYDFFCLVVFAVVIIYIIHRQDYKRLPFILLMCGIFYIIRGIFIVLTPFGNPPEFNGSDPLFNGFSKYELGVYPSGHTGDTFLLLLLVNDKIYKYLLWFCVSVIVISLFLAHSHYSIDILSGFIFSYAIKTFGEKYFKIFDLGNSKPDI